MRTFEILGSVAALAGAARAQGAVASVPFCDAVTKICYQRYTDSLTGIAVGVALPNNVGGSSYDAIVQIVSPVANKWAGFAWGGTMVFNPLIVGWPNGNKVVHSSRMAYGLQLPAAYDGATYTFLKGSGVNSTHWTVTVKCTGCTSYTNVDNGVTTLNGTGTTEFALVQGDTAVNEPANNASSFNIHKNYAKWTHDLNAARSPQFESWVSSNLATSLEPSAAPTSSVAASSAATGTTRSSAAVSSRTAGSSPATGTGGASGAIPASCPNAGAAQFQSKLATGWKATKVLGGLTSPRSIIFDTAGNMLIVQSGKGITVHSVDANGCITSSKNLISQTGLNHGIALSNDGKTLYASTANTVSSWAYDAAGQSVSGSANTVVKGMFTGIHTTRTLLIAPHLPNVLLVSHGSSDNWDYPTGNPSTGRSVVRAFDMSAVPSGGYTWTSGGWLAGYGMRNEVGITFDNNNMLWGVENSGDQFTRQAAGSSTKVDIHIDNPAEKLNYIGDISKENKAWFGYPTCFTVWKPSDFKDATFKVGDQFVVAPNATFKDSNCKDAVTPPSLAMQAHSAPIDAKFDADNSNLYISFHGSWNRSPTTGFKLVVVPFTKGSNGAYRPVADVSSDTGYQDVMSNPDVTRCQGNGPSMSSGCFRPAGLMFDKSGRLYMTSDTTSQGEIWVLGKS